MSQRTISSVCRTLLYFLSFSTTSLLASGQDIFSGPHLDSRPQTLQSLDDSHYNLDSYHDPFNPETPTCLPDEKYCSIQHACIPSTYDCCSADTHCFPGDYCFIHDERVRCCPEGIQCYQISGTVCLKTIVFLYVVEEVEHDGEVVTERYQENYIVDTTTRITVTASYPHDGRALYSSRSLSIEGAAETAMAMGIGQTLTTTVGRTSTPTPEPLLVHAWDGEEVQMVLG